MHLHVVLGVFQKSYKSSFAVENLLAPASTKKSRPYLKNFYRILKTRKAKGCGLYAYNLLKGTELLGPFWTFSQNFQSTFRKFGQQFVFITIATWKLEA